uniref:Uncharacterized protein n=1 Tax=Acrobeloides nanus TaxID=290746 RepID=A0A914CL64_9BILA
MGACDHNYTSWLANAIWSKLGNDVLLYTKKKMGNRIKTNVLSHPEKTFEAQLEPIFMVRHDYANSSVRRWKVMKGGAPPACHLKMIEDVLKEKLRGKKMGNEVSTDCV